MKYMIASDIHGSSYYCQKLMDAYKYEKPDRLILLGDILYHGPRNDLPKYMYLVIQMLNSISDSILCVRGNCDCEVDQMVLNFPCLADYSVLDINGLFIYCTHGHLEPVKLKMGVYITKWTYTYLQLRSRWYYLYEYPRLSFDSKRKQPS